MPENKTLSARLILLLCACLVLSTSACRSTPTMQHYQMTLDAQQDRLSQVSVPAQRITLGVDEFTAEAAYDDVRLIYRKSLYRLDYYHYHRWSSPPSMMITDVLRVGLERTGAFKAVTHGYGRGVDAVLRGRVVAIEEVDKSEKEWSARITLNLSLEDGRSGEILWSKIWTGTRDVELLNPEGVTIALSQVLGDLVIELTPTLTSSYNVEAATLSEPGNAAF